MKPEDLHVRECANLPLERAFVEVHRGVIEAYADVL
jgi:hypothetical protein